MTHTLNWLHISDIHFCTADSWRDDASRSTLLTYLSRLFIAQPDLLPDLIFCTGDIAFGELKSDPLSLQYNSATDFFDKLLLICGRENLPLPKERLFVVPGNHDIDRSMVNSDAQSSLIAKAGDARSFISSINKRFGKKDTEFQDAIRRLHAYEKFVAAYLPHQVDDEGRLQYSKILDLKDLRVGIGGFNSSWTCSGDEDDRNLWLAAEWQFNSATSKLADADLRLGLIHHPVDWFNVADREFMTMRIASDFDFWLHGHSHSAWVTPVQSHTVIAAGAIGAEHTDEFGINLTSLDLSTGKASTYLHTRRSGASSWTIAPIAEHAPQGRWDYSLPTRLQTTLHSKGLTHSRDSDMAGSAESASRSFIQRILANRLTNSLRSYSTVTNTWVPRVVSEYSECDRDRKKDSTFSLSELIGAPVSCTIKAPPQYGLTCLAHYIVLEAWRKDGSTLYLYLDAKSLKPHRQSVEQYVSDELQILGKNLGEVKGVILDSWSSDDRDMGKILDIVSAYFKNTPLIIMQQCNTGNFSGNVPSVAERTFVEYFLWALSRNVMRNMVASYNEARAIGDEDAVTTRLASDLDVLNLHRTPLNCITLLKVSEFDFDENPVNRSEIIKRVLFLLFNVDKIPDYKSRPDLKDCEFVLGRFCELQIRTNAYVFARDKFLMEVQKFCKDSYIDLETQLVFDVLFQNNIIVKVGAFYQFKFAYWIYYFAAQRMTHSEDFRAFIFEEMRYARFPEIVEFYTGVDRMRNDALETLIRDLNSCHTAVREKSGLPGDVNPYRFALWETDETVRVQMRQEIADGVRESNLPAVIKDQYLDERYDTARPFDQNVRQIISEHSFLTMLHAMSAGARALRNSDYASPEIKRQLLREIMSCWNEVTRAMFIVLPLLAQRGHAAYDGMGYYLGEGFGATEDERFISVLTCIPSNVVQWGRDDIYSRKMAPLLVDRIDQPDIGELEKHSLVLLLIYTRPRDWEKTVQRYIAGCARNSFYLMDVYQALRSQYKVGFFPNLAAEKTVEFMIKMATTKHLTGEKRPTEKSFKKVNFGDDFLPAREE